MFAGQSSYSEASLLVLVGAILVLYSVHIREIRVFYAVQSRATRVLLFHQTILEAVGKRLNAGLHDVVVHTDGAPFSFTVGGLNEHTRPGAGAGARV